jgi:hypothetical protein
LRLAHLIHRGAHCSEHLREDEVADQEEHDQIDARGIDDPNLAANLLPGLFIKRGTSVKRPAKIAGMSSRPMTKPRWPPPT